MTVGLSHQPGLPNSRFLYLRVLKSLLLLFSIICIQLKVVRGGALFHFCSYWEGSYDLRFHTKYSIWSPVSLLLLIPPFDIKWKILRLECVCIDSYLNIFNHRTLGDNQLSKMASDITLPALIGV